MIRGGGGGGEKDGLIDDSFFPPQKNGNFDCCLYTFAINIVNDQRRRRGEKKNQE